MPDLSRSQLLVYGAVAVALLLVGARAIRAGDGGGASYAQAGEVGDGEAPAADEPGGFSLEGGGPDVVVDVTGAVRRPGVYRLPAGGAGGDAALEAINLAARLADGQQVLVPSGAPGGGAVTGAVSEEGPISLGSASVEELETIDGIGPVTAGDIVEFRDQHGGLASVDQLDEVPGIGPATMEALRERLQP
jgi:competence protein ComEA